MKHRWSDLQVKEALAELVKTIGGKKAWLRLSKRVRVVLLQGLALKLLHRSLPVNMARPLEVEALQGSMVDTPKKDALL